MCNKWVVTVVRLAAAAALIAGFTSGSASAGPIRYTATLSGAAESPPNASPATGDTLVTIDATAHTMRVQASFSGLLGTTTVSHIHCCTATPRTGTAGVATTTPSFPGFPLGVTSGTYDQTFDMTLAASYNPAFVTAQGNVANAMAALFAGLAAGNAYFNIHTNVFPGGEIRGFPAPAPLLQSAASRKVHGNGAGIFDLPLSAVATNPTTEPRQGPAQTIVFTFDKPISAATASITEGTATAAAPTFSGNDVIVGLTGVTDQQYVTIALSNVAAVDGGFAVGGAGSVRIGFLVGDVNQNRVVSVADLGLVNAQLAQTVNAANYLKDVNASGTLTVADKGITNANLTRSLPAP